MVANSDANGATAGGNTGYPAAPEEIAHFMKMLKAAAPKMTSDERSTIEKILQARAKELGH